MINQIVFPAAAVALTSGASQPEFQTFSPAGSTEMVNMFSGDFNYNIPLLEVPGPNGGYPINLFYNSVTNPDAEASWTGLGWNINIGAMGRAMRGLPDDFDGEEIRRRLDSRVNETTRVGGELGVELAGINAARSIAMSLGLSLQMSYVYNSYAGPGISIDPMLSLGLNTGGGGFNYSPNLSLGMSVSTIDQASANVGFGLGDAISGQLNFNAVDGFSSMSLSSNYINGLLSKLTNGLMRGGRGTISFAKRTYTPPVQRKMLGTSFLWDLSFMGGGTVAYGKFGITGSYGEEKYEAAGDWLGNKAYGYNYLQNANVDNLLDFNREKDGPVHIYNRYLANPVMTYDVYNVSGQGMLGAFRSHRSDYGFLNDPSIGYHIPGGSFGGEGGLFYEFGLNGAYNWRDTHLSNWPYISWVSFKDQEANSVFEPFYYKMAGDVSAEDESTYDYLGNGDAKNLPLRLKRKGFHYDQEQGGELLAERNDGSGNPWYNDGGYETKVQWNVDKNHRENRKPRNISVQPATNSELWTQNGEEVLPEYNIKYYDQTASSGKKDISTYANGPSTDLARPLNNQNGGFSVLGQDGVRWTYGLPVMNTDQKDAKFSYEPQYTCTKGVEVIPDGDRNTIFYKLSDDDLRSNDYIDEQQIPAYAHTYLLTSVLGNDYADIDGLPGPTDGDEGYWMKTNYVKLSNGYQWRAPFLGANYMEGYKNEVADDIAGFMWGSREVYLPASIETKTHIAYFEVSRRYDGRGAKHYIQNKGDGINDKVGAYSYKLDKIKLYSKKEIAANNGQVLNSKPLKTVHFTYDYSLCKDVPNNDPNAPIASDENANILDIANTGTSGKLTLKEVYFTYEGSTRGRLSPYKFDYNSLNPDYNDELVDRWGVYRSKYLQDNYDVCDNTQLPYTRQSPSDKTKLDEDVAAWHLEKVTLPSGAQLSVNVERDDYGYVQDAVATRMFRITSTAKNGDSDLLVSHNPSDDDRYLQFELEQPIATGLSNKQELLQQYIDDLPLASRQGVDYKQLYYKVFMNLRNSSNTTFEYVPGYAEIDKNADGSDAIEFIPSNTGQHTHARLRLKRSRIHSNGQQHHPISVRALKFLKDKLPRQMLSVDLGGPPNAITSLDQIGENIEALFSGYYNYGLVSEGFAKNVNLEKSYIKLNSPDKIQYGEGLRVKSIVLEDNWNSSEVSTLGTVYDYTTEDENGNIISSGVLENESQLGYDECALRWAVVQEERREGLVKDVHDYEYPMNEAYYPGASVGYSKVTMRSLASNYALEASKAVDPAAYLSNLNLPQGFGTTGETVYEYYTAKEFPVITSRTSLDDTETNPWVSMVVEALTMVRYDHYTGTQGYSIELNDMHGKTKKVTSYGQKPDGTRKSSPLTMVEYQYKTQDKVDFKRGKTNQMIKTLDNTASVLLSDNPEGTADTDDQLIGVDYEFFIDGREMLQTGGMAGLAFNVDAIVWWPFPFPQPQYSYNENRARTSVANKIIQRSGILEKVIAFDGQATLITENKVFDKQTGAPLLATVNNQLGGEIYNYSVPAYMAHERMGSAAENWGILYANIPFEPIKVAATDYYEVQVGHNHPNSALWYEGDEFIVADQANNRTKAIYMGELYNDNATPTKTHQFDLMDDGFMTGNTPILLTMKNVRSGNRNLVGATVAQYSTLDINGNNANPLLDANRVITNQTSPDVVNIAISNGSASLTAATSTAVTKSSISNVLSASGADFSDDWSLENYNYCSDLEGINPYIKGTKGIWRARSSYAYIDDRNQNMRANLQHTNEVDIATSGTVDNVALYNWKNPFAEYCSDNKWIRTQDVTKYQIGGAAVEARDVIGTYQSSIYGYDNNLVIAQGVNTQYHEMAYEGFEEPNKTDLLSSIANTAINSGHFDIIPAGANCNTSRAEQHENYRLTYPMAKPVNNKAYVLVRKAYNSNNPTSIPVSLYLRNETTATTVEGVATAQYPLNMTTNQRFKAPGLAHLINSGTQHEFTVYEVDFSGVKHDLLASDWWAGDLILRHPLVVSPLHGTNLNSGISDAYAHTGKYSLKLNNRLKTLFPLNTLRLQEGKDYVFSAWIRVVGVDGEPQPTYALGNSRGVDIGNQFIAPSGPIIEGWQRIEGTFTADTRGTFEILTNIGSINDLKGPGMYIDDMRIFPADGNMVSYVYDPVDYKIRATLDDNNYATFYLYDKAGSLISSKRETERGVITLQESRSYVQPTN